MLPETALPALLLDAHVKSSLAAIRSLGRRGIPIIAGSHRRAAMGLQSRYTNTTFVYPSPFQNRSGFVEAVIRQLGPGRKAVLLAFSDSTLLPLFEEERFLDKQGLYVLPLNRDHFTIALDKACTLRLAQRINVEVPPTWFCGTEFEIEQISRELTFPLVLKPRRSIYSIGNSLIHKTAIFAFSPEDLRRKFAAILSETGEAPLIQKLIRGEEAGVEFLCDRGKVLAVCAHRRIRSFPPSGGAAVVKETVPLSYHGLGERAERIVGELNWSGPIMVEFKMDNETAAPRLMEVNGRFWGSLPLAVAAGVDFPYLYYKLAIGEPVTPTLQYRAAISRHFWADFKNLIWVCFARDPIRPYAYPRRLRSIWNFLSFRNSYRSDVLDPRDVMPTLAEVIDIISRLLLRAARRSQTLQGLAKSIVYKT